MRIKKLIYLCCLISMMTFKGIAMAATNIKTLGVIIFPGFELLDVAGPLEMFGNLPDKFKVVIIGEQSGVINSTQGVAMQTDTDLAHSPHIDYLLIPGGMGTRKEVNNPKLIAWIKKISPTSEITMTVCTGAALLAKTGLLDGRPATSNKLAFTWVTQQGENVKWARKARWVDDGNIVTSSGVAAGIDMSLHVIARLYGLETSQELAKKSEYLWSNDPSNDPFS